MRFPAFRENIIPNFSSFFLIYTIFELDIINKWMNVKLTCGTIKCGYSTYSLMKNILNIQNKL